MLYKAVILSLLVHFGGAFAQDIDNTTLAYREEVMADAVEQCKECSYLNNDINKLTVADSWSTEYLNPNIDFGPDYIDMPPIESRLASKGFEHFFYANYTKTNLVEKAQIKWCACGDAEELFRSRLLFNFISCEISFYDEFFGKPKETVKCNHVDFEKCSNYLKKTRLDISEFEMGLRTFSATNSKEKHWKTVKWNELQCFKTRLQAFKKLCVPQA